MLIKWSRPPPFPLPLCPVSSIKCLLGSVPASSSSPLFLFNLTSGLSILTAPVVLTTFSKITTSLRLSPAHFGFYAFRRSTVSWASITMSPYRTSKLIGGGQYQQSTTTSSINQKLHQQ